MFKKKSLKFTYEKVSRDLRHAETLKARESSRFKRLSMIRSINDSDFLEKDMEASKEKEVKVPEKKKPSRLEMLFKWKQEKQIKKEMEKQAKKKPFYVGGKKEVTENKALLSFKSSSSFNSTKSFNSKLVTPTISNIQSSRIFNSKQGIPGSSIQSRLPNTKQITPSTTIQSSKILSSKQPALPKSGSSLSGSNSSATTLKKFPPSASVVHKTALPKSNLCRSNSTATLSKKVPTFVTDRTGSSKYGNSLTRSNSTASIPKKFPVSSSTISKIANSKAVNQKVPFVNKASCNPPKRAESHDSKSATLKSKSDTKSINKVSTEQKSVPKHLEEKSVKKIGTVLSKVTSNVTVSSRGTPVQSKETLQRKDKESLRKGYCFRTAISNSMRQQTANLLKTPIQGTPKKIQEKISKNVKPKTINEVSELSVDNIPDVTFNSDISIIKPARTSFAPANFTFQPPEKLNNFIFEDEDYDVYQALEEVSRRFMSRTSTPSKDSGRKSSVQSSKESLGSNNNIASVEKTSNISNSNDVYISELMSPESFHIKTNSKIADGEVAKKICDEVNSGIKDVESDNVANKDISQVNSGIKEVVSDDVVNEETCKELTAFSPVKTEADVVAKEESFKKNAFVSPLKIETGEIKDESYRKMTSPIKIEAESKEETCQKVSISPLNIEELSCDIDKEMHKLEIVEHIFDKQMNLKESTIGLNSSENNFKLPCDSGTRNKIILEKFIDDDDDDSLLDSIDLNKIQLMNSDDEDSGEDDVASPQILKCSERKSNGTIPKRVSMLRKLSIMNAIAETSETDECVVNSAESARTNQNSKCTPRRSKRLSNHQLLEALNNSPAKSTAQNPSGTPRRSLRLMKHTANSNNFPVSPFQEKNSSNVNRRHSVRLIDLSTPEKAVCEKLLGENFENLDPNAFLIDFESPTTPTKASKSKKVSLLYSPEKRKSMRKSIRGDLISFSPA